MKTCPTCHNPFEGRGTFCSTFCATAKPCRTCRDLKTGRSPYCEWCRRDRLSGAELTLDEVWLTRQVTRDERPARRPNGDAPEGKHWCSGCREWLPPREFVKYRELGKIIPTLCRACRSARQHATRIKADFGMSVAEYEALLTLQGGVCAICGGRPRTARLAVDHDHVTERVRGLLCKPCNLDLLDGVRHSPRLASRAALYLTHPPAQTRHPVAHAISVPQEMVENLLAAQPWLTDFFAPYLASAEQGSERAV